MTDRTGILKKSPLIYALASIRFAPWPLMAQKIDEIHDDLRDITPLIHKIQIGQVGPSGQAVIQNEVAITAAWVLVSSDRSFGFLLTPDQMLFFSKKYTRYVDFETNIEKGLDVLLKYMRFLDVTNQGVRYVDHIKTIKEESLELYISSELLPANFDNLVRIGGTTLGIYKSGDAELRVRCTSQPDASTIPDDIISLLALFQEPGMPLRLEMLQSNELLLDIDALKNYPTPQRMKNKEDILSRLKSLHYEANVFFRNDSVCTDHAFKVWKDEF